jgi:hypothetical protein
VSGIQVPKTARVKVFEELDLLPGEHSDEHPRTDRLECVEERWERQAELERVEGH